MVMTSKAFQPDGKPSLYKSTVDRLQEQLVVVSPSPTTKTTTIPLVDDGPADYWFHPKIHTFGNHGPLGALHAGVAPLATKLIDVTAYDGENVRDQIARDLSHSIMPFPTTTAKSNCKDQHNNDTPYQPKIVDLACGVGMSTRALQKAFPHAAQIVGMDTSPEMIRMAKALSNPESWASKAIDALSNWLFQLHDPTLSSRKEEKEGKQQVCGIEYNEGNAEYTGLETGSFDLATIM